jgi:hypothetical protein
LFFLPLAMLVAQLARLVPLEGGLYRWSGGNGPAGRKMARHMDPQPFLERPGPQRRRRWRQPG